MKTIALILSVGLATSLSTTVRAFQENNYKHVERKLRLGYESNAWKPTDPMKRRSSEKQFHRAAKTGSSGENKALNSAAAHSPYSVQVIVQPEDVETMGIIYEPGDLNIRFNKIKYPKGPPEGLFPLVANDFPMEGKEADTLKHDALAASVVTADDFEISGARADFYVSMIGGNPPMPNGDPQHAFWDDFRAVVDVQIQRRADVDPSLVSRWPDLWKDKDIHQVAAAVHDEYPGYLQQELISWLWSNKVQIDYEILPYRSRLDFIGKQVRMADLNTWAIGAVAPLNFHLKWCVGRARPEEVAFKIASGNLTAKDGVPQDIVEKIDSMNLTKAEEFTAYPEGCPLHPSWPAMHSAASSSSFWLAIVMNLTVPQYCEARRVDYAVAYACTVAGVHFMSDNIAGLNLGQLLVAEKLPNHLAEMYGSDPDKVEAKMKKFRFDWADFDPETCQINST